MSGESGDEVPTEYRSDAILEPLPEAVWSWRVEVGVDRGPDAEEVGEKTTPNYTE
jgi:hypothetical protein